MTTTGFTPKEELLADGVNARLGEFRKKERQVWMQVAYAVAAVILYFVVLVILIKATLPSTYPVIVFNLLVSACSWSLLQRSQAIFRSAKPKGTGRVWWMGRS